MTTLTSKSQFINQNSRVPKYRQVANTILWEIEQKVFKTGQRLPSINEASAEYYLSRDTVEKAYRELVQRGVISSIPGKGFYVNAAPEKALLKVVLVLNKLSNYKLEIYQSLVQELGKGASSTIFVHDYDVRRFQSFILDNLGLYDYYVVCPHFPRGKNIALETISKIPPNKLILLDRDLPELKSGYGLVYQDYAQDLQHALMDGMRRLKKYRKLVLVFPATRRYSTGIKQGFTTFCQMMGFEHEVRTSLYTTDLERETAYLVIEEKDLLDVIKMSQQQDLRLGQEVGLISYNDAPNKELLAGGITVITTDHTDMGRVAGQMILRRRREKHHNAFRLILRNSL